MPITLILLSLAGAVCAAAPAKVEFKTPDGWTISADYRPPRRRGMVMILAHGVASSKGEWSRFADGLAAKGVGSLAVDLRGHGESTKGPNGERDFKDFDATGEWVKAALDLRAAAAWLEARGVKPSRVAFGGASIGAHLASQVSAARSATPCLLLLSPGPDYRGVRLVAKPGLKVLVVASPADRYAHQTLEPFSKVKGAETLSAPDGHGVQVFNDAKTLDRVVAWAVRCAR
ncbi:MAG: alpha/beta fold hydrolase [Elusimicrobiota bacterium]